MAWTIASPSPCRQGGGPGSIAWLTWPGPSAGEAIWAGLDPVGYSRWAFTPAIPFMRGYEAALREAYQAGRLTASAG